jgi:hypothetical protein
MIESEIILLGNDWYNNSFIILLSAFYHEKPSQFYYVAHYSHTTLHWHVSLYISSVLLLRQLNVMICDFVFIANLSYNH